MHPNPKPLILLAAIFAAATANATFAADASPSPGSPFTIPMNDQTTATAIILPAPNAGYYLVTSTSAGKLGFWLMSQTTPPTPDNPPQPPKPPAPPQPPTPQLARVVTITATQPQTLDAAVAAYIATIGATYNAYTIAQVATPNPPPDALKYIGLAAGKQTPYTFLVSTAGQVTAEGPTPTTAAAFLAMLGKPALRTVAAPAVTPEPPPCPAGCTNCQPQPLLKGRRR